MTAECDAGVRPSSPSLPRRDDLDLVAALQHRLGPAAFRQHVVIHGDREMGALIVELAQLRRDADGIAATFDKGVLTVEVPKRGGSLTQVLARDAATLAAKWPEVAAQIAHR